MQKSKNLSRYLAPVAVIFSVLPSMLISSSAFAAPNSKDVSNVSVSNTERIGNGSSYGASLSDDKNLVAFVSSATNLVATSTSVPQAYLRNRSGETTTMISKSATSAGNGAVSSATISRDGTKIVFATAAKNLTSTPEAASNIYTATVADGSLSWISNTNALNTTDASNTSPDISGDGSSVVFITNKTYGSCTASANVIANVSGTLSCISSAAAIISQTKSEVKLSSDGSTAVIVSTASGASSQIFSVPVSSPSTAVRISELSSVAGNASSSEVAVNQDGTKIVFASTASNLTSPAQTNGDKAIYLYRQGGSPALILISKNGDGDKCNGTSSQPAISENGNYIAFLSTCRDLLTDNPATADVAQVFIYDVSGDSVTTRASVTTSGASINGPADGRLFVDNAGQVVMFSSTVNSISPKPQDTTSNSDVFIFDSTCGSNSDAAGTTDCTDECPYDASKDADEGACGCGLSENDADSDGTADCEDACPTDPLKISSQGLCGCGSVDTDADGNGVADCLDPNSHYVPRPAHFVTDAVRTSGVLIFPGTFADRTVTFEYQFIRDRQIVKSGTTKSRTQRIRPLGLGRFILRYRVKTTSVTSRWSKSVQINMRPKKRH